ncbi:MAG: class I SAM-dependent methyltransferase [Patescibacteria group bacterium]|jgi:ubiquinone/menaquinone biosynthesis C-methylase UbiE
MNTDNTNIEQQIIHQFDVVGDKWVEESVHPSNFELTEILEFARQFPAGAKILDAGSGKGKFSVVLAKQGLVVTGVEPAAHLTACARSQYPEIDFQVASLTTLPFPNELFDGIICVEVLGHIPDLEKAIQELFRVLKPGGKLLILDKNIRSLNHLYFLPTKWWRGWRQLIGQRMYPTDFPFQDKYFVPTELDQLLGQYSSEHKFRGIAFHPDVKERPVLKRLFWRIHQSITRWFHHIAPNLDFFMAWEATK